MRLSSSDSPKRYTSDRGQSASSTRLKLNMTGKIRRVPGKNVISILQQRQNLRVLENNVDVTPKPLLHNIYNGIDEKQLTAFDAIGLYQGTSNTQLLSSGSANAGLKMSSSFIMKSASLQQTTVLPLDDLIGESILSCQLSVQAIEEDRAPSQFCLPRYDSSVFHVPPAKVTITLKETETFFIFEMPQLTEDLGTPEGIAVKEANERYEYITVGAGSNRKLASAESQTPCIHTKSRSTYLGRHKRQNQGTFVNNWVMYDTYRMINQSQVETNVPEEVSHEIIESQNDRYKLPKIEPHLDAASPDEQLVHIFENTSFRDAVRVMERIIASNLYIVAQKRFKGLIRQDPCSLDLQFTYSLDLLWKHTCLMSRGRAVSCFRWNYVNGNLLAAGYGALPGAETKTGVLLIWSIKNPSQPDRWYSFDCPISDMDWSHDRPNLLAIGFYDGVVKVIDVSNKNLTVMRHSRRQTSPSYEPHWQVQWWTGEEQFDYQEQIYTSNQDGRVLCYRTDEDFSSTEIMRIPRIEGKIRGVGKANHCSIYDIPISRNPGALLLRRHPTLSAVYFVGSDEGCVHRCSTNYLHQHVESFLAHDGPIYSMQFSPFCSKIFLTCGADWCTRIWAESITEPLITLSTQMACVRGAAWSPNISTVIASIVNNEICLWDIRRKTYVPTSITISPHSDRLLSLEFTKSGNQLVVADVEGVIYVYSLEGVPFPPYNQTTVLAKSIEKALITKPGLLKKLKTIGYPF